MGSKEKPIKKLIYIIISIWVVLFILVYLTYFFTETNSSEIYSELFKVHKLEQDLSQLKQSKKSNEQKLEDLKKIKNGTQSQKDEYFEAIRELEEKILNGESNKKIAYITIDDGPYDNTPKFLEILKEYQVPATFFVLEKPSRIETYKQIIAEGHTIGNHTASHKLGKDGIYTSPERFINDVHRLNNWLTENVGVSTTLYRFPGGSPTAGSKKEAIETTLRNEGYNYVDWNVIVGDGSDKLLEQKRPYEWFLSDLKDQKVVVVLMHDYCPQTLEDLPKILKYLKDHDYMFLPLSNKSIMVN